MSKMSNARIREALTGGTSVKEKGPPVADGVLSVTPDTPEIVEWRRSSALDVAETSSSYLDDDDDGGATPPYGCRRGRRALGWWCSSSLLHAAWVVMALDPQSRS